MQLICSSSLFISWVRVFTFTSFFAALTFLASAPTPASHLKTVIKNPPGSQILQRKPGFLCPNWAFFMLRMPSPS